jgi:hypothetical protein
MFIMLVSSYRNNTMHFSIFFVLYCHDYLVGDNVLPLASQMILDYYLASDLLYASRMLLTDYHEQGEPDPLTTLRKSARASGNISVVSSLSKLGNALKQQEFPATHIRLMEDMMSNGGLSLAEASGMCFRRMVWGHGPHLFYTSMMQRLRRLVSRFAREFAKEYITYKQHHNNLTIIDPWSKKIVDKNIFHFHNRSSSSFSKKAAREHQLSTHRTQLVSDQGNPLKILIYSRGNNIRRSRAIDNETAIVAALKARGAAVTICCDYSRTSLVQQLFNAVQADVIMGVHGAALVHGVFMAPGTITIEWKTLYAYESILFPLISDGHMGIHAQVDIRDYFLRRQGGHAPVDEALVTRIVHMLDQTVDYRHQLQQRGEAVVAYRARSRQQKTFSWWGQLDPNPPTDYNDSVEPYVHLACPAEQRRAHQKVGDLSPSLLHEYSRINFYGMNTFHDDDVIQNSNQVSTYLHVDRSKWPMVVVPPKMYIYHFQEFVSLSPMPTMSLVSRPKSIGSNNTTTLASSQALPKYKECTTWVRQSSHRLGDLIFPLQCTSSDSGRRDVINSDWNDLDHVLGPTQSQHAYLCVQSTFHQWRLALQDPPSDDFPDISLDQVKAALSAVMMMLNQSALQLESHRLLTTAASRIPSNTFRHPAPRMVSASNTHSVSVAKRPPAARQPAARQPAARQPARQPAVQPARQWTSTVHTTLPLEPTQFLAPAAYMQYLVQRVRRFRARERDSRSTSSSKLWVQRHEMLDGGIHCRVCEPFGSN